LITAMQALPGATYRCLMVPAPLAMIALSVGGRLASRTGSRTPLVVGHDAAVLMIDTSMVRVHEHRASIVDN
jgi:hypothetical protein